MKEIIDNYKYEKELNNKGITLIAGVDEVGRGPLIGPVVAAAVILPENYKLDGLTDSKKLSEKKREQFFEIIKKEAIAIGVGIISEKRIDEINIYEATKEAMYEAINNLNPKPSHVLIDAMKLDLMREDGPHSLVLAAFIKDTKQVGRLLASKKWDCELMIKVAEQLSNNKEEVT